MQYSYTAYISILLQYYMQINKKIAPGSPKRSGGIRKKGRKMKKNHALALALAERGRLELPRPFGLLTV